MSLQLFDCNIQESSNALVINRLTLTVMSNMVLDVTLITHHDLVFLTVETNRVSQVFVTSYLIRIRLPVVIYDLLQLDVALGTSKFVGLTKLAFEGGLVLC